MTKPDQLNYMGVIIAESLEDQAVLSKIVITKTTVEPVTERHQTPWLKQWTLHEVEIPVAQAAQIAEEISQSLDHAHGGSWYADFRNADWHYVIFRGRVFQIDRSKPEQYAEVVSHGLALGIPAYQLDFSPVIREWER